MSFNFKRDISGGYHCDYTGVIVEAKKLYLKRGKAINLPLAVLALTAWLLLSGNQTRHLRGEPAEITPGIHEIECRSGKVGFEVPAGETFHFDYWGP